MPGAAASAPSLKASKFTKRHVQVSRPRRAWLSMQQRPWLQASSQTLARQLRLQLTLHWSPACAS